MYYFSFFLILISVINGLSVSGNIYDIDTNNPIESVNIFIDELRIGTSSDNNGYFQLVDLPSGDHKLFFSIIGYKSFSKTLDFDNVDQLSIEIKLQKDPIQWTAINVMGLIPSKHSPEITEVVQKNKISNTDQKTLSALLGNLHGIEVQSAHAYGRNVNISIRGSSDFKPGGYNNRVLLLLDGFPVSIPNSGSSDWNAIPFETIKHIEVVRGPASSIYGHNSMGGVINVVTKTGGQSNEWYPELRYGSYGSKALSMSYSGNINNTKIVSAFGHGSSDGHRFNSGYKQTRFSLKLNKALYNNQKIQLSFINSNSFNGQPGFVYPDNPGLVSYRESERESNYLQFYYKAFLGQSVFSVSLAANRFDTDYNDRNDAPSDKILGKTHYRDQSYIARSQLQKFFNNGGNIIFGMEFISDKSRSNVLRNIYTEPKQITIAGFTQYRKEIIKNTIFDLGLRYDFRQVTGGDGYQSKVFKSISPKFSLYHNINQNITGYLSYNEGFRAPSISELFLEYESSYGLLLLGNPDLKSEFLTNLEMGLKYNNRSSFTVFGNIFINQYTDMIDFIYTIPVKSVNRESVKGLGFEFGSNIPLSKINANINLTYSYLEMENINSEIPLLYRPKDKVRLTLSQKTPIVDVTISTKYTSSQLYEDFLSDDHPIENNMVIFPLEQLPETIITSAIISKTISDYDISLKVNNLFDSRYVLIQYYPMPGRNFEISINKILN